MTNQYTHIVLGGGGFTGLVYLGAIRYFQENNITFSKIIGTSVGAFFGVILAFNIPIAEIKSKFHDQFIKRNTLNRFDLSNIFTDLVETKGIDEGINMVDMIYKYIGDITFGEFKDNLYLSSTQVETMNHVYFSAESTPDVRIIDGLRASMALPLLIKPIKIGTEHYIDGGITNEIINIPIPCKKEEVLIMYIAEDHNYTLETTNTNMLYFLNILIKSYMKKKVYVDFIKSIFPNVIHYNKVIIPFFPFEYSDDDLSIYVILDPIKIEESDQYGYDLTLLHILNQSI
jgi:predicted patatin/cPLA2 family phospholipase